MKDEPLPMMDEWMSYLIGHLNQVKPGLSDALGFQKGLGGQHFEQCLGVFLAWRLAIGPVSRLSRLGTEHFQASPEFEGWAKQAATNEQYILKVLYTSLHDLMGVQRVSNYAARDAYKVLLDHLRSVDPDTDCVFATTNYDVAIELGLEELNITADNGVQPRITTAKRPVDPTGLVDRTRLTCFPVLHLHGRIGWYQEEDGTVWAAEPSASFDESRTPGLLLPGPNKGYSEQPVINQLWTELDNAIERVVSTNGLVFVIGHSLNDDRLVEALRKVGARRRLLVGVLAAGSALPNGGTRSAQDVSQDQQFMINKFGDGGSLIFHEMNFGPGWEPTPTLSASLAQS
jgi:hypothetical protein